MAISPVNHSSTHNISFGSKSLPAKFLQDSFKLDDKSAEKVDNYGKLALAGGVGAFVATGGRIKSSVIGLIATPVVFYGANWAVKKAKEYLKKDSEQEDKAVKEDTVKIPEKSSPDKPSKIENIKN